MEEIKLKKIQDETLENVSGGTRTIIELADLTVHVDLTDSQGRPVRWYQETANGVNIWHYECKKCRGYLHFGTLDYLYCDPCDYILETDKYKVYDVLNGKVQ
ncbi:MAG: hypothetical protein Q4C42_11100 [Clostridia bacterium]|nr:hypothetical protein [Clostridia bacterium]